MGRKIQKRGDAIRFCSKKEQFSIIYLEFIHLGKYGGNIMFAHFYFKTGEIGIFGTLNQNT